MKALVIKLFGTALGCMACSSYTERASPPPTERASPPPIASVSVENYPKGAWWRSDLSQVALAPAHILIRFAGSATADTDIHVPDIPITRSEVEARLLAQRIVIALRKDPSQFDALAREHSDDLTTRERGGASGRGSCRLYRMP